MDIAIKELDAQIAHEIDSVKDYAVMVVDDDTSLSFAGDIVQTLKNYEAKVVGYFKDQKDLANKMHKLVCAKEKEALTPAVEIRTVLTGKINGYLMEQRRKQEEARRKAEEERKKAEDAERARLAEEARKAEEAARAAAEAGNAEEAAELAAQAEEIKEAADSVVIIPEVVAAVEKTTKTETGSISGVEDIQLSIADKKALVDALFAMKLDAFIDIDLGKLKRYCKDTQAQIPGLTIEKIVSARFRGNKAS